MFTILSAAKSTDSSTPRQLIIHKYLVENPLDSAFQSAATGEALDAVALQALETAGAIALDGIEFNVRKVYTAYELNGNTTGYTRVTGTDYYYLTADTGITQTTGSNGKTTFNFGTTDGVYYVVEKETTRVDIAADPFLVSVPMSDPQNEGEWLYTVNVYPKNKSKTPTVNKTFLNGDTVLSCGLGDIIPFKITAPVPVGIASMVTFFVSDNLTGKFDLVIDDTLVKSVTVTVDSADLEANVDYAITYSSNILKIDFTNYLARLTQYEEQTITITFDAVLASFLVDTDDENSFTNTAVLTYQMPGKNDPDDIPSGPEDPTVYFGSITIDKFDGADDTRLDGAVFKLATSAANAAAGIFVKDPTKTDDSDWTVTTVSGTAVFGGLAYDIENGTTYYLVEITAPAGYNRLRSYITATITDGERNVNVEVANHTGFVLPMTGGAGVIMFSVIGGFLMIGSLVLLVISKKKKEVAID